MRVTVDKNELMVTYSSFTALVTPTFKHILHRNLGTYDVIAVESCK